MKKMKHKRTFRSVVTYAGICLATGVVGILTAGSYGTGTLPTTPGFEDGVTPCCWLHYPFASTQTLFPADTTEKMTFCVASPNDEPRKKVTRKKVTRKKAPAKKTTRKKATRKKASHHSQSVHFHSVPDPLGTTESYAEVGGTWEEECRGMTEFNLQTIPDWPFWVHFDVYDDRGMYPRPNRAFQGPIVAEAYRGNGRVELADFDRPVAQRIGTFDTIALAVGDTITLEVTDVLQQALLEGWDCLGIRLRCETDRNPRGSWLFNNFRFDFDCNGNGEPDEFDLRSGVSRDDDHDGVPDECFRMRR